LKAERAYESDYLIRCFPHQEDIIVKDAKGTTITDSSGKKYLDLFAGIAVNNVGHCHPKVVAAVREQAGRFMHHSNYYHDDVMPMLAKQLADVSPKGLTRSFFANSGTEAIDGSVKLAKKYASMRGKNGMGIVSLQGSFHGRLSLTLSLTGQKKYKERLGNYAMYPGIFYAPTPYHFRYGGSLTPDEFGRECAERMEELIDYYSFGDIAAVIVEPIMGEAGIIVPPDTYLPAVQRICRSREIPLIADEVQTGVGRTGRMFASQHWNIEPSIMAFAKGIGGGLPLGGFIATEELAAAFETGDHFSTFGGNPVCCAAGLAVLEVVKEEGLVARSRRLGDHALKRLGEVAERSSLVGEVRGKGLMIGVELVREKKRPADREATKVKEGLKRLGFIIGVGGLHKNVLRLQPPLIISEKELDTAVDAIESTLRATSDRD
jgi:4-aminobutyrate aminotransferase / (S)-3-amino-2-methylpropionate transaminase / 5-aminovalerate transaminase